MTITVELPDDLETKLAAKASGAGVDLPTYARRVLEADVALAPLDEVLRPIRDAVRADGLTEEALTDLLEAAKHEMRAERRAREEHARSA